MNQLVSLMIILLFSLTAIGIVLSIGSGILDESETFSHVQDAEALSFHIRDYIRQVSEEGNGSSRIISMNIKDGYYEANSPRNSIVYYIDGPQTLEYLSRKSNGDVYTISGSDADCSMDSDYLYLNNSRISVKLQRKGSSSSWTSIDTSNNVASIKQIDSNTTIQVANSSILINDASSSASGNGYSELMKEASDQPLCIAHFFINSSYASYDVYYTLFSGADFIMQEVQGSLQGKIITSAYATHINSTDTIWVNGSDVLSTDSVDSTYAPERKFISAESNATVFGMAFAGYEFYNISLKTMFSGSDYMMKIRQGYENNRLLLTYTEGNWGNVDDHMDEISSDKLVGSQFSSFESPHQDRVITSVAAIFKDVNMTDTIRWSTGIYRLVIRNEGEINNITNIGLEID